MVLQWGAAYGDKATLGPDKSGFNKRLALSTGGFIGNQCLIHPNSGPVKNCFDQRLALSNVALISGHHCIKTFGRLLIVSVCFNELLWLIFLHLNL